MSGKSNAKQFFFVLFSITLSLLTACGGSGGDDGDNPGSGATPTPSSPTASADELTLKRALSGAQNFVVADDAVNGEDVGTILAYPEMVEIGASPSFTVVGGASDVFAVSPGGLITVADAAALGAHGNPHHELTVRVSKTGHLSTDITVTIELLDADSATFFDFSAASDGDGSRASPYNSYRNTAGDDTTQLFKRGTTLDLGAGGQIHSDGYDNILVASYGSGALPRIIGTTGSSDYKLVAVGRGSDGFILRDVEIATDSPSDNGTDWVNLAVHGYAYNGAWSNVNIEHCHIHHSGGVTLQSYGSEPNANNVTVAWNHIHDIPSDGVFLQRVDGNSLVHANRISRVNLNWHFVGHSEGEANGDGIQADDTGDLAITRNYVERTYTGNKFGVIVGTDSAAWVEISDNYFVNAVSGDIETTGVHVFFPNGRVSRNYFVGARYGAYASIGGSGVTYDHNVFDNCLYGIHDNIGHVRNNVFYGVGTTLDYGANDLKKQHRLSHRAGAGGLLPLEQYHRRQ